MMYLNSGHAKVKVGVCGSYELLAIEGPQRPVSPSAQSMRRM